MLVVASKGYYICRVCKQDIKKGIKCVRYNYFRGTAHLCPKCAIKKLYNIIKQLGIPKLKVELWKDY